jgi:ribose transport system substrate-binding protein
VGEYLKNKKLDPKVNFTPNPPVTQANIKTVSLDGYDGKNYSADELCSGAWGK